MVSEKYSNKDFTNLAYKLDLSDAEGQIIKNSCFYCEEGSSLNNSPFLNLNVLKAKNVTFIGCNMDNCIIPPSCTLIDCCNRFIRPVYDTFEKKKIDMLCNESGVIVEKL